MKTNISPTSDKNLSEKMEDYFANKPTSEEAHELENLALEDDFTQEAMEGLENFPDAISSIPDFPKGKNYTGFYVTVFTILASALIWFMVLNPFAKTTNNVSQSTDKELIEDVHNKNTIENTSEKKGNNTTFEPKKEVVTSKNKIEKKEEVITGSRVKSKQTFFKIDNNQTLKWETKRVYDLAKIKTKTIGFHNFLAVDYSVIYTNSHSFETEINGVFADRENKDSETKFGDEKTSEKLFSYKEYLKKSLGYLENKNYGLAIESFKIISKHYPNDVNAEFYLGYIYFYTNEMEMSINQMDKTINNSFDVFKEDAEWYKANALQKTGRLKKAAALFKKIKADGGYYSHQVK